MNALAVLYWASISCTAFCNHIFLKIFSPEFSRSKSPANFSMTRCALYSASWIYQPLR